MVEERGEREAYNTFLNETYNLRRIVITIRLWPEKIYLIVFLIYENWGKDVKRDRLVRNNRLNLANYS